MRDYGLLLLSASLLLIALLMEMIDRFSGHQAKAKKYDALKPRLDNVESAERELQAHQSDFAKKQNQWEQKVESDKAAIETLSKQKSLGFPWLATAYADYFQLQDMRLAGYLQYKSHPARTAAEKVRQIAAQKRVAEQKYRVLKYQLEYYENLFPWLVDFREEDIDDLIRQTLSEENEEEGQAAESDDPARKWLTASEYSTLTNSQKYQLALDRYWQKKKSRWEIGRDYERYIGYLYERAGNQVHYHGIVEGFADLGRDLVVTRVDGTEIVQCKCWSQHKTIHEKHIFQLFGTAMEYYLATISGKDSGEAESWQLPLFSESPLGDRVGATFYTSTKLSEKAKQFAQLLRVRVVEESPLQSYPSVKCNISRRSGEKIYHLPFDQQYDRTVIEDERNECYVETVKEAESLGFRRAFRWRGSEREG